MKEANIKNDISIFLLILFKKVKSMFVVHHFYGINEYVNIDFFLSYFFLILT